MTLRARFHALIDELAAHPDITTDKQTLGAPTSGAELDGAEAELGRRLPAALRAFYAELDGVEIRWSHRQERWRDFGARGAIRMLPVGALARVAERIGGGRWIPIDFPYDTSYLGLARRSGGFSLVEEDSGEARALTNSFSVYLDALLEARGWAYWQHMFLYQPRGRHLRVEDSQGRMQAVLPVLFPGFEVRRVGNAAKCRAVDITSLLAGERLLVYRLRDLPPAFTEPVPAAGPLADKLFFLVAASSSIPDELFAAIPEPVCDASDDGRRIAEEMGRIAGHAFCLTDLIAPEQQAIGGRRTIQVTTGFHTGSADAVEAWLRRRGCQLLPIDRWFAQLSFFTVRAADGAALDTVQMRSRVVNSGLRRPLAAVGRGIFVVDRSDDEWQQFVLYHHPDGLKYGSEAPGPGEHCLEVALADLAPGQLTALELGPARGGSATQATAPADEWIAVGRPSELPAAIAGQLPAGSPFASRLFWLAPAQSPLIQALRAALVEPPLAGISAAFRVCDMLEQSAEPWRLARGLASIAAGFHTAEGADVEAWLRTRGCRTLPLAELLT
ncbi:SMI1/KNR4 family protein [Nannocystis bainbridge]|uniref:SMI1/KNR4 family protein n=1 Tax=Nannocystis bainbridge TaxID=2995303 RepID=A0ABT5DTG2_9BACT|nr:SMI1/KNR4 family protein [Nannocystis bainbridge]MDC0716428.1 SMI1/KNR4 family protein [Nannocystis bainbridge]